MTSYGRFVLWVPSKIYSFLFFPGKASNNFYEFLWWISVSLSPDIKTTNELMSIFFTASLMSNSYTSYLAFFLTSCLSLKKTQGNKHVIKQGGTYPGECFLATCLHKLFKHLKEESATITSAFPYFKALAAPILLPQRTTLYLFFYKWSTTDPTYLDYLDPKVTLSSYLFFPQPIKSKQPRENREGKYFNNEIASSLDEEFPWRYKMIQLLLSSGLKRVN